jgi:hypothetical protein
MLKYINLEDFMKTLKLTLAALFFVTSITFDQQVLKTSENLFISKWSVSFGIQTSHALMRYLDDGVNDSVNFE